MRRLNNSLFFVDKNLFCMYNSTCAQKNDLLKIFLTLHSTNLRKKKSTIFYLPRDCVWSEIKSKYPRLPKNLIYYGLLAQLVEHSTQRQGRRACVWSHGRN